MKKNTLKKALYVVVFIIMLVSPNVKAQSYEFAPVGAEWYYTRFYRVNWGFTGVACDRFTSVRTVDINGLECKEIELYQHLDCNGSVNPYTEIRYIYQDNDLVYEVEDGNMYLLYDFSKEIGEYWVAPKYSDTIIVRNVSQIMLDNGTTRKVLSIEGSNNDWIVSDIIEGVGMKETLFPLLYLDGATCHEGPIRCYFEDGVQLISSDTECDYEVLSVEEDNEKPLVVVNTFVGSMLYMSFLENQNILKTIQIFDITGRLIFDTKTIVDELNITFNDKPAGMYLLRVTSQTETINVKIVKR